MLHGWSRPKPRYLRCIFLTILLLAPGCAVLRTATTLEKSLATAPREVLVGPVENATGRELAVRSGLVSRLLSTASQASSTIPPIMGKVLRQELSRLGVAVIEPGQSPQRDHLPVVSVTIEKWEEASTRAYGRVVFLSAVYRLVDPESDQVLWQVRQERLPLPIEKMALDRRQAEGAAARAVREALKLWPEQ